MSPLLELVIGVVVGGFGVAVLASSRLASRVAVYDRRQNDTMSGTVSRGAQTPGQVKVVGALAILIGAALVVAGIATL
jgi:hypothetical protein